MTNPPENPPRTTDTGQPGAFQPDAGLPGAGLPPVGPAARPPKPSEAGPPSGRGRPDFAEPDAAPPSPPSPPGPAWPPGPVPYVPPATKPARSQATVIAVVCAVSVLVLAAVGFVIVRQNADEAGTASPGPVGTTVPPDQLVAYENPVYGVKLSYPKTWTSIRSPSSTRPLILQETGNNGMWISALGFDDTVDLKTFARQTILTGSADAKILAEQEVTLNGVAGFYYVYTFFDTRANLDAVHAHYFLAREGELLALVFQASPVSEFQRLAPSFDQIAETVRLELPTVMTTPPTTAASAPTTVP